MNNNEVATLKDLMMINNDRIAGYQKAADNLQESDSSLRELFYTMKAQSENFNQQITGQLKDLGAETTQGTTTGGKLYRAWMDVKDVFGGDDAKSILASCERGEDAARSAYQNALQSNDLSNASRAVIQQQFDKELEAHNKIKSLRDQQ